MSAPAGPAHNAEEVRPWPVQPLPFEWAWIRDYKPEPVTVQTLMHKIVVLTNALEEIGESLEEWWDSEGEDQHPIQESGYRDLPRYYEQWLMNAACVAECQRLIEAYWAAVKAEQSDGDGAE